MKKLALALLGAAALVAMAAPASALVACNREGDCWHVKGRYAYDQGYGITVHPDNWRIRDRRFHWREHDGRGYWRSGLWVTF